MECISQQEAEKSFSKLIKNTGNAATGITDEDGKVVKVLLSIDEYCLLLDALDIARDSEFVKSTRELGERYAQGKDDTLVGVDEIYVEEATDKEENSSEEANVAAQQLSNNKTVVAAMPAS